MRRWLASLAPDLGIEERDDLNAIATELVGNAVQHAAPLAGGELSVDCSRANGQIEFAVTDGGSGTRPLLRQADLNSLGGRGLLIVNALSDEWGVRDQAEGRTVWARLSGSHSPDANGS